MSDGGKGSRQRPLSVDPKTFENNWDLIFGKKNKDKSNKILYNNSITDNVKDANAGPLDREVPPEND